MVTSTSMAARQAIGIRPLAGHVLRLVLRVVLGMAVLPALYLIEPFYRIRLGTMYTQRFGHLAINAETFLRKLKFNGAPSRTWFFFFGYDPANRQLCNMWKRRKGFPVTFVESRWGARLMFAWRPILKRTRFWEACRTDHCQYRLFAETDPILSFTDEEEEKGREALAGMNIGEDDWFVCFHARDQAYFMKWRPEYTDHWETMGSRNVDVLNFLDAAKHVASLGGYALRYGAGVDQPLPDTGEPRIVDYAVEHRSDFMDVYLAAKCHFFIGSASGPDSLSNIFNVPLLCVNRQPYNQTRYHRKSVIVPRLLTTRDGSRRVGYREAQEAGYFVGWTEASWVHEKMDLYETQETGPEDILDGVRDMIDLLEGREPPAEAREIQDYVRKTLSFP